MHSHSHFCPNLEGNPVHIKSCIYIFYSKTPFSHHLIPKIGRFFFGSLNFGIFTNELSVPWNIYEIFICKFAETHAPDTRFSLIQRKNAGFFTRKIHF